MILCQLRDYKVLLCVCVQALLQKGCIWQSSMRVFLLACGPLVLARSFLGVAPIALSPSGQVAASLRGGRPAPFRRAVLRRSLEERHRDARSARSARCQVPGATAARDVSLRWNTLSP